MGHARTYSISTVRPILPCSITILCAYIPIALAEFARPAQKDPYRGIVAPAFGGSRNWNYLTGSVSS